MKPTKNYISRKKQFAPPTEDTPWDHPENMMNASDLQKAALEAEMNRQDARRKKGFEAARYEQ